MSQQEFVPEPQGQEGVQSQSDEGIYAKPYYWSTRRRSGNEPKEEHPSTYEESIPPYSYRAQDSRQQQRIVDADPIQQESQSGTRDGQQSGRNRSYARPDMRWQVPSWARPQQNRAGRTILRLLIIIGLAILLIKVLPFLLAVALAVLGVLALIILLPIIIIFGLLIAAAVILSTAFRRNFPRRWRGF